MYRVNTVGYHSIVIIIVPHVVGRLASIHTVGARAVLVILGRVENGHHRLRGESARVKEAGNKMSEISF